MLRAAVVGEAIIDLIEQPDGAYRPHLGGSPYNVARALARQGAEVAFLNPFSDDHFGSALREGLSVEGVATFEPRSTRPTSLAVVHVDGDGQPAYAFYRADVADRDVSADELVERLPDDLQLLHTGSLALVPGDIDKMTRVITAARERGVVVALDLNLRPVAVPDLQAYREGIRSLVPLCHLVKGSDEDLAHMGFGDEPLAAAQELLGLLEDGFVAVTRGGRGAALVATDAVLEREAHAAGAVIDTVGAGDCFHAGLLIALAQTGLLDDRRLTDSAAWRHVLDHACATAGLNVARAGCHPPTLDEVRQTASPA